MMWIRRKKFEQLQGDVLCLKSAIKDLTEIIQQLNCKVTVPRVDAPTTSRYYDYAVSVPTFCNQLVRTLGLKWQQQQTTPPQLVIDAKGKAK